MKKSKLLLVVSLFTVGALTACNSAKDVVEDLVNDDKNNNNGDAGEVLPYTVSEARNKLKTLGQTSGFEITLHYSSSDDSGEDDDGETTIGYKSDILWVKDDSAYKKTESGGIDLYGYEQGKYVFSSSTDGVTTDYTFDMMVDTVTSMFYYAYDMTGMQYQTKTSIKFLNRDAYQYSGSYVAVGAAASFTVIIDVETGITLKVAAAGSSVDGESGSAALEVTAFKTGNAVVLPELVRESSSGNGDGGNGTGGNGEGTGNGQGSGNGEGSGEGSGHTGTGEVGGNGDDTGSGIGESGDPNGEGQGGEPEDLSKYLVTAAQYKTIVTDMAYLAPTYNVKVDYVRKDDTVSSKPTLLSGTFENGTGIYAIQDVWYQNNDETINRKVYAPNAEHEGYYDFYNQINNGDWEKGSTPMQLSTYLLSQYIGLDVASLIPLSSLNEPASLSSPYYSKSNLTVKDEQETQYTLTNVKMKFENGLLVEFTFVMNRTIYEFNYLDFGRVEVQAPQVQDNTPVKHNEYIANKQFAYQKTDLKGYTGTLVTEEELATMAVSVYKFFDDNTYELDITQEGKLYVDIGTYELMVKPNDNIAELKLRQTTEYFDGEATGEKNGGNRTLQYDVRNQLVKIIHGITKSDGTRYDVEHIFTKGNEAPTKYEVPVAASNWPTTDIAQKLAKLGFSNVVPEIYSSDKLASPATAQIADNSLHITCEFANSSDAALALVGYISSLNSGENYNLDWANCDADNGLYAYLSSDNKMSLIVVYVENSAVVNIYAKKPLGAQYPTKAISDWLEENNVTDDIPEFTFDNASYSFTDGALVVTLPNSADPSNVIKTFAAKLTTELHFTVQAVGSTDVYVSPNRNVGFAFSSYESQIYVTFGNASQLPSPVTSTYPSKEIGEFFEAKNVNDELPDLSVDGAEYAFYDNKEDGEWTNTIAYSLQLDKEANLDSIISGYETLLADFTYDDAEDIYLSPNKQFEVEIYVDKAINFIGITISISEGPSLLTEFPSGFITAYLSDNNVTDSYPNLAVEGATYYVEGEKDDLGEWPENIDVNILLPEGADAEAIAKDLEGKLEGFVWNESEEFYNSLHNQINTTIYGDSSEGYIRVSISAVPEEDRDDGYARVIISVPFVTNDGEAVYLIGDFCDWEIEGAIRLEYKDNHCIATLIVPEGTTFECKLVVAAYDNPESIIRWETEGGDNRIIVINESTTIMLAWGRIV